MLTRRAQFSWVWWVEKSAWMLRWPPRSVWCRPPPSMRPVGDQALDAGELAEAAHEPGRAELARDGRQGRAPGLRVGVGVLGLVDVEVAVPPLVAQARELSAARRRPPGTSTSSSTTCGNGPRRGVRRRMPRQVRLEPVVVDRGRPATCRRRSWKRLREMLSRALSCQSAARRPHARRRPTAACASACSWSPTTPPPRSPRPSTACRRRSRPASTTSWCATTPAPTRPTTSPCATSSGPTCRSRSSSTRRTSATAATRRPATTGPSTTGSTWSCCCTVTASTPPR